MTVDVNLDGVLEPGEAYVNWLEFHIKDPTSLTGPLPSSLHRPGGLDMSSKACCWATSLLTVSSTMPTATLATAVPAAIDRRSLDTDSDGDGMPDGWEIHFRRWAASRTAGPQPNRFRTDRFLDADDDGMTNWEEYNAIDPALNQLESIQSSPQFYVTTIGTVPAPQQWASISVDASFGSFASAVLNASGPTADPNNPDTDGDGIIDGMEVLLRRGTIRANVDLNPMVPMIGTSTQTVTVC